jgi:xylulokinase
LLQQVSLERIAALAISNQRETFVPLDAKGQPVRQAIVWLDQRCKDEVAWLSDKVGADNLHLVSGKPLDDRRLKGRLSQLGNLQLHFSGLRLELTLVVPFCMIMSLL